VNQLLFNVRIVPTKDFKDEPQLVNLLLPLDGAFWYVEMLVFFAMDIS
jgi:hypothetical protein